MKHFQLPIAVASHAILKSKRENRRDQRAFTAV
jgi:hypothetical protein